ncbi:molybdenum cofactor guanylyltransferase MobA, partial [Janthinobacterium sp.]|uniref:molybdenum cofactor guanylyltransferase MobA n=1 Tax=Janthinobacterium sp. TaxID=1871054 RepID=UPI00293D9F4D
MIHTHNISGLILAGGQGTRMGRVDKGLLPLRGEAMAARVLRALAPQVGPLAINANQNLADYAALGAPVWPDDLAGFEGPLAGLQTGLRRCATAYLLSAPCDSPFLPADLAARLAAALLEQDADLAIAVTLEDEAGAVREQAHPVFCLMKTSVLPALDAYLASGGRRMDGWHGALRVARVVFPRAEAFRNLNTPQELRDGEAQAASLAELSARLPGYDGDALSVAHAQRIIGDFVTPIRASERVALRSALGRVLAADILSPIDVPAHDNSAMDGYALRGADLRADAAVTLRVAATALAGHPAGVAIGAGECARIMTGAVMPEGCDSVVPQELVSAADGAVTIPPGAIRAGANRRFKGEDLRAGGPALRQGKIVRPAELGLLASLGIAEVAVRRRLRVAFFSTGDELVSIGGTLGPGQIYDSNRYTMHGMLTRLGCEVLDMGVVRDTPEAVEAAFAEAAAAADVVMTSGGVSVGDADYVKQMLDRLGDVLFWKIAMKPGRPLAYGRIGK